MKTIKTQVLRGPNVWSNYTSKIIQLKINLEDIQNFSSIEIINFSFKLYNLFPNMNTFSILDNEQQFIAERNKWFATITAQIALQIQKISGMNLYFVQIKETINKDIYNLVFEYELEQAGIFAAEASVRIMNALLKGEAYSIDEDITKLKSIKQRYGIGPSTLSIILEAEKRGIPWRRLGVNSKIQLGYGCNQKQFQATMTCNTSNAAVNIAGDKEYTKSLLKSFKIPVASGSICSNEEELLEISNQIGFPIVIKPLNGNQGKGATIGIENFKNAKLALIDSKLFGEYAIVEKCIAGNDYRLLVVDGKFVAASKRVPANIIGDGISTIIGLIEKENENVLRGESHEKALTKIKFDKDTFIQLEKNNYTIESVVQKDKIVFLKSTANLSTGGTAEDVTEEIHPENIMMAERIARIIGLDICGIDVMAKNINQSIQKNGGVILEVNAAPGFRMHLQPSFGKPRNVGKAVVDMLYPQNSISTIPVFAITGTNGKTTTTRLLAHIARRAGYNPGYTTTDGIYIGTTKIADGDTTGPDSGRLILSDPIVDFAVLETARGGLLRAGLCFDSCDIGIITNIKEDHLGLSDIETLSDLANVKAVVAKSVKKTGWAILNAEDENCIKISNDIHCNLAFFALNEENNLVQNRIKNNRVVAVLDDNYVTIIKGKQRTRVGHVATIPLTENGKCNFMIENVLAASLAAYCFGFKKQQIESALQSFLPSYEQTPGRMNLFKFNDFKVLVDYAHNPHGLLAMKDYLENVKANRKIGIIAGIGDRKKEDTIEIGRIAATMFDYIIIRQEHSLRGNTIEQINNYLVEGIQSVNSSIPFEFIANEKEAITQALTIAESGDFIVAFSDLYNDVIDVIETKIAEESRVFVN